MSATEEISLAQSLVVASTLRRVVELLDDQNLSELTDELFQAVDEDPSYASFVKAISKLKAQLYKNRLPAIDSLIEKIDAQVNILDQKVA